MRRCVLLLAVILCTTGAVHASRALHATRAYPSLVEQALHMIQDGISSLTGHHKDKEETKGQHWALLVAGSAGWWNYRHQADVCHAYQILRGGLAPERIVTMVFDDIANNANNPFPGKIFNRPGGPDVYTGVQIDYSGTDVNAQTTLAVLEGNATAVAGVGSGRVIASGPHDRVFVFYSDHGAPGVLGMPFGPFLYADELHTALKRKYRNHGYKEMTMYIEACESGSMFQGLLGKELNIYATTAANAQESSWGTYCPGMDPSAPEVLDTCLGDLYSVAWMEDTECEDLQEETLKTQFQIVQQRTSDNFTYGMGSHAMQYGRVAIQSEHLSKYLGLHSMSACMRPADDPSGPSAANSARHHHAHRVHQRDADLVPLRVRVAKAKTPQAAQEAQAALDSVMHDRRRVDVRLEAAAAHLMMMHDIGHVMLTNLGWSLPSVLHTAGSAVKAPAPTKQYIAELMTSTMGRDHGSDQPLVDSWDCLRDMVASYSLVCGPMDQYSMKHTRLFANLCNAGVNAHGLRSALTAAGACAQQAVAAS